MTVSSLHEVNLSLLTFKMEGELIIVSEGSLAGGGRGGGGGEEEDGGGGEEEEEEEEVVVVEEEEEYSLRKNVVQLLNMDIILTLTERVNACTLTLTAWYELKGLMHAL